jgi:hypothetical protein
MANPLPKTKAPVFEEDSSKATTFAGGVALVPLG